MQGPYPGMDAKDTVPFSPGPIAVQAGVASFNHCLPEAFVPAACGTKMRDLERVVR